MLEERMGIRIDLIEHQLSHSVRDAKVRAYNRTQFLKQRAEMIQTWADVDQVMEAHDQHRGIPEAGLRTYVRK